jgi:hypothetical protein
MMVTIKEYKASTLIYLDKCAGFVRLCSEWFPDGGTPVPKHVELLYSRLNVFYKVHKLVDLLTIRICTVWITKYLLWQVNAGNCLYISYIGITVKDDTVPALIQHHAMKAHGGVEVYKNVFLIAALDVGEWPVSRLGGFSPWKEPQHPLDRMLDWSQTLSGHFRNRKKLFPLPGIENKFLVIESVV